VWHQHQQQQLLRNGNRVSFSGGSRICKRGAKVERRRREYRGAEGAEGSGVWGVGVRLPNGEGSGEGALSLKMATFGAFWARFLQFIVHSSMDCLKHCPFPRKIFDFESENGDF